MNRDAVLNFFLLEVPTFLRQPVYVPYLTELERKIKKARIRNRCLRKCKHKVSHQASARHITLEGEISHGLNKEYAINGHEFTLHPDAWIIGELKIGCVARVKVPLVNHEEGEVTTAIVLQSRG